jgi:1-acyl-sn-glycerol-3-phosphate acyltransferase
MGKKSIDKWTLKYWATKYLWARNVYKLYYKRIELYGAKKIKHKEAIILAPNHQNALMDALALVTRLPFQTIFLARADIFKSKFIISVLTFLKILPIYRKRDGISSLGKNEEIFDQSSFILKNRYNPMCMFPEGNHGDKRRLRPLVKGIFRIAFQSQAEHGTTPYTKIIPVGIDYSHYQKFQQTLLVQFGDPIQVSEFWEEYEENQAKAINSLRERLAKEMKKLMIDIQSEDYYDTIMGLRPFYRQKVKQMLNIPTDKLRDRFFADKELIKKIEASIQTDEPQVKKLDETFKKYSKLRDQLKFRDWVFRKDSYSLAGNMLVLLSGILLAPVLLLGFLGNWPHYIFPPRFGKKIKDTQFQSTAIWGIAIVIQALYYILLLTLGILFLPYWWLAIVGIVLLPFIGIAAYRIRTLFVKTWAKIRFTLKRNTKEIKEVLALKNELNNILDNIMNSQHVNNIENN